MWQKKGNRKSCEAKKGFLLLISILVGIPSLHSQNFSPEGQAIQTWLGEKYKRGNFHGAYCFYAGDSLVAQGAYGFTDKHQQVPILVTTPFMVASVSKTFTATAVLRLYEQGKLDLDEFLVKYLKDYPLYQANRVKVKHCLNHTSGIPCYMNDRFVEYAWDRLRGWRPDPTRLIRRFSGDALNFQPGKRFSYSNSGYSVLAKLVERISGMPYEKYIEKEFIEPLHLDSTQFRSLEDRGNPNHAFRNSMRLKNIPEEMAYGMGAITTTATDLVRWLGAIRDTVFLKSETEQLMTEAGKGNYGLGWELARSGKGEDPRFIVYHGGYFPGWTTLCAWFPDENLRLVLISNQDRDQNMDRLGRRLVSIFSANLPPAVWNVGKMEYELEIESKLAYRLIGGPAGELPDSNFKTTDERGTEMTVNWGDGSNWLFNRINPWTWELDDKSGYLDINKNEIRIRIEGKEWVFLSRE